MAVGDERPDGPQDPDPQRSVLHALGAKGLRPSLVMLRDDSSGNAPLVNTRSAAMLRGGGDRYQVLGEVARGGMGVVFKGRDTDLGRDVAMKVLLEQFKDRRDVVQRFVEEAQIGGQLQHPGIVPVYEMGLQPDGRPYFTMKLVKGRTLAALLAERKGPEDDRRDLLRVFESVCQTISYAHSRGVIHRDLKPSNVMVGAFGQVQVVDWGLAKVRGQEDHAKPDEPAPVDPMTIIATVRSESRSDDSLVGSILGTPAYMSPEQARGEVETLDERSDVFALGAILCEILTGFPPFTGTDREVVIAAARGKVKEARLRLDACTADPALVELAKSCLTAAPLARPVDAGAVASELAAYFHAGEEREQTAREEEAVARIQAEEERRAHRLTMWLATSVLLTLLLAGGAYAWVRLDKAQSAASTARQIETAARKATQLQGQAHSTGDIETWAKAVSIAKQAVALAESPDGDPAELERVRKLLTRIETAHERAQATAAGAERDLATAAALDAVRIAGLDRDGPLAGPAYARVLTAYGLDPSAVAPADAWDVVRDSSIALELAGALAAWARERRVTGGDDAGDLVELAVAVDGDAWRRDLRRARDVEALRLLESITDVATLDVEEIVELAAAYEECGDPARAGTLLAEAVERYPDSFWAQVTMGSFLRRVPYVPGRPPAADDVLLVAAGRLATAYGASPEWKPEWFAEGWFGSGRTPSRIKEIFVRGFEEGGGTPVRTGVLTRSSARSALVEYAFPNGRVQAVSLGTDPAAPERLDYVYWYALADPPPVRRGLADPYANQAAIRHLTAATALRPESGAVRVLLADALFEAGEWAHSQRLVTARLAASPDDAGAQAVLGRIHLARSDVDAAVELLRAAATTRPDAPEVRLRLGAALRESGRFDEALTELRAGRDLASARGLGTALADVWVAECTRLVGLDRNLDAYVSGKQAPAGADETVDLARLCALRGFDGRAAALWEEAFGLQGEGGISQNPHEGFRREAARAAVRAAQVTSAAGDRTETRRLVRRAFEWLQRDLAKWEGLVSHADQPHRRPRGSAGARAAMLRWKQDPVLAPLRTDGALDQTSEADLLRISSFWLRVDTLLEATDS